MAVAIGDTEALSVQAVPDQLPAHWFKFCALAKVWARSAEIEAAGQQLRAIVPPPLEHNPVGRRAMAAAVDLKESQIQATEESNSQ